MWLCVTDRRLRGCFRCPRLFDKQTPAAWLVSPPRLMSWRRSLLSWQAVLSCQAPRWMKAFLSLLLCVLHQLLQLIPQTRLAKTPVSLGSNKIEYFPPNINTCEQRHRSRDPTKLGRQQPSPARALPGFAELPRYRRFSHQPSGCLQNETSE